MILLALSGWAAALGAAGVVLAVRQEHVRRMELVARACHELRGPLGAARLGLHLGRAEAVDSELERASLALSDLAAAREGRTAEQRAELVDAGALARDAVASAGPVVAQHGAEVQLGSRPPVGAALVRGDRRRLAQACANLLVNGAEHGAGPVELSVRIRAGRVRVAVQDAGPGLPVGVDALIAGRRLGARGHGLGVVAEVARLHGGRLAAAPSARGACLVLDLPLARAGAGLAAGEADGQEP